jgi:uroporphyrinogen-III decarboxylase
MVTQGYSGHVPYLAQSEVEVNRAIPTPARFSRKKFIADGNADLAQQLLLEFGDTQFPFEHVSTPLWNCYFLWGFEGMMTMIAERPNLVQHACDRFLTSGLRSIQRAATLGAAGIWIEDSLTDLISPKSFETLNLPYLHKLVEKIHACGMHSIYYYCGNPSGKLSLLLESGAEALALEESKKGFVIDLAEIVKVVQGRCVLFGNLDAIHLLPHSDEKKLRSEIRRQIAVGRENNSRFVMSLGSPVTPGTSPERVRLYCDIVHEEGSR